MKKTILALSAGLVLGLASCNNDVSDSISTVSYSALNLVMPADGTSPYLTPSTYSYLFNMTQGKAAMTLDKLSFDNTSYSFSTDTVRYNSYTYNTGSGVGMLLELGNFKASLKNNPSVAVKNINCDLNGVFYYNMNFIPDYPSSTLNPYSSPMVIMQYDVPGLFSVKTIPFEAFYSGKTSVTQAGTAGFTDTQTMYRVRVNDDKKTADVLIYDLKLTEGTNNSIRAILLEKLPMVFDNGGYTMSASEIVPKVYGAESGSTSLKEDAKYTVNDFWLGTDNYTLTQVTLQFKIAGEYTVSTESMSYVVEKSVNQ